MVNSLLLAQHHEVQRYFAESDCFSVCCLSLGMEHGDRE